MWKNYARIAFRNIKKKPVYTFINLAGLAVAIACCIFIGIFVADELSYDSHHSKRDQIYRISQNLSFDGETDHSATTPFPLMEAVKRDFSAAVKEGVRFFDMNTPNVSIGNNDTKEFIRQDKFFFADSTVFSVFDVPFLQGNPKTALVNPNTVVVTRRVAEQYFGDEDPVGKELVFEGRLVLTVTGVMEEWPRTSHFRADILASFNTLENIWGNYEQLTARWRWNPIWTYLLLEKGTNPAQVENQFPDFIDRHYSDYIAADETIELNLQPLTDIRLYSDLENEIEPTGSYIYIYLFSAIAILILGIACINYINLSTVQALRRSKEVGLRKTLGAYTAQLKGQFMIESFLHAAIAVVISIGLTALFLPEFNEFTNKDLSFAGISIPVLIAAVLLFTLFIAVLAGFYPSVVLASYNPVESLRETFTRGKKGGTLRRSLVVLQFTVAASLLIGTALAWLQYNHLQKKDMGFEKEQVVVIPTSMSLAIWYFDDLKDRMLSHSGVENVSGSKTILGSQDSYRYQIIPEGYSDQEAHSITKLFVEHDFTETMKIPLLAGRTFSKDYSTDPARAVLINRNMVDYLGWGTPEDALGRTFKVADETASVIGVTENFHHTSLRKELIPLLMELPRDNRQRVANIEYLKVRLSGANTEDAISHMKSVWDEVDSAHPFEYYFLDDKLKEIYESEQRLMELLSLFSLLAIIIGCLGLFGLASYSVVSRTKEIGIRKALGSTAAGIFYLLSKDYLRLVVFAHIIALPVMYYLSVTWLENFPYRIELVKYLVITFLGSILISICITLLTISSQALKAAFINPVDSLKRE